MTQTIAQRKALRSIDRRSIAWPEPARTKQPAWENGPCIAVAIFVAILVYIAVRIGG